MNSLNNLSNTILQSSESSSPDILSTGSSSSSSSGFVEGLQNISATTWILIVLILTFLGFNIFVYLANGTEQLNTIFGPLITAISGLFSGLTGQVVDVSAEGAKSVVSTSAKVINAGAGVIDTGLTDVQNITPNKSSSSVSSTPVTKNQPDIMSNNTLNKALNSSQNEKQQSNSSDYQADEASSSIQSGPPKSGWCYIGEDRGFRTCGEVGVNDKCMSGDIFPTQEICVNPSLRA